jgi:AraC-like DNA-binding protein
MLGRDPLLGAGDGVLMWNAYAGSMAFAGRVPFVTFRVPCAAVRPLVTDLDATVARRIPAETEALQLLGRYLNILREPSLLGSPAVVRLAATHVYDLLAVALGATRDAAHAAEGRGLRAARLRAIKSSIAEELGRRDLSVVSIAARHRLTPRYVQMLFEAEGTTFTEFLLGQRLLRAHRMLSDPRFAQRSVTSIAFDTGFADLSHFDRSFRRRYGSTPTEVRRTGLQAG